MNEKKYLGDGAFVQWDDYGNLVLTTSDGISDTNTIVLEPEVRAALRKVLDEKARR